jgi:hypothetical protein
MGLVVRSIIGLVTRPYETMRGVVERANVWELLVIAIPALVFYRTVWAGLLTYGIAVALFWTAGKLVGSTGKFAGLASSWGYTLIPTILWFFMTAVLYFILPPPRTTSFQGILFSILYLVVSATLFFWKVTLGYLALRFGLKLDLKRILVVVAISAPILGLWSYGLYRLGIMKVPFL